MITGRLISCLFLLMLCSCASTGDSSRSSIQVPDSDKISVALKVPECLPVTWMASVSFHVSNKNGYAVWINSKALSLESLTDSDGHELVPLEAQDKGVTSFPEYLLIPADTALVLPYQTSFFWKYELQAGRTYSVRAGYTGARERNDPSHPTITRDIVIPPVRFVTCQ